MNHIKFTGSNNSSFIKLLISAFNKCKNNPDLEKYSELVSKFLELLNNKKLLQELDDSTHSFIDNTIEKEFIQLKQDLKSTEPEKLSPLLFNEKIINRFFIIIYYQCYIVWFQKENSPYEDIYSESICLFNKNFHLLNHETTHIIIDRTRFIPKQIYDSYMKNNKEVLNYIKKIEQYKTSIGTKIQQCSDINNDIEAIEKRLRSQRQEFNFIGLSDAFQKMKGDKQKELNNETSWNTVLMIIIMFLLSSKIIGLLCYSAFHELNITIVTTISLSLIFLIAVLIYFFRISLINIKSIKSQILQLDLRLSLCQFIHNYAEDSEKMRKDNMKDSLDRFESIIFSPIVANEEQIPATFDNLDQFIKMMNVANGGKGETKS